MKKFILSLFLSLFLSIYANAGCDDAPGDGVDYEGCAFSDEQNLSHHLSEPIYMKRF